MVNSPLRGTNGVHSWFWKPNQENDIDSLPQLLQIYEHSVGQNSNMVLGVVIDPHGLVPDADGQRLAEFRSTLKQQYAHPLGCTKGTEKSFIISMQHPQPIKKYMAQEDIRFGERVRSYEVSGKLANGAWTKLDEGSCIGHKRMAQVNDEHRFIKIKLEITGSDSIPHIREFVVY